MPSDAELRITNAVDSEALAKLIEPKMRNLGGAMGARMQRLVPKRTWALHDTIDDVTTRDGSVITTKVSVGSDRVTYGMLIERGTSKMSAQPFIRPAFAQTTGRDLNYSGKGTTRHGIVSVSTRRSRTRARSQGKKK